MIGIIILLFVRMRNRILKRHITVEFTARGAEEETREGEGEDMSLDRQFTQTLAK